MDKELKFCLENVHQMTSLPICCVNLVNTKKVLSNGYMEKADVFETDPQLLEHLILKAKGKEKPGLEFEDGIFAYGLINDISEHLIIIGPVTLGNPSHEQIYEFKKRHNISDNSFQFASSNLRKIKAAISNIVLIRRGKVLTEMDILNDEDDINQDMLSDISFQNYVMDNAEQEVIRLSYVDEKRYKRLIIEGDVESVKARKAEDSSDYLSRIENQIGNLATNKFKHFEYMACASIILFSRAAIEGGMDVTNAYALSDLFLQRLEKCKTVTETMKLSQDVQLEYTIQVRKVLDRQNRSFHVEKAKSYIANHLNKSFVLEDISEAIGVSKTHLAQLFSNEEGVSVMEYTRNKRIEAAANMLKYSDESISNISSYLCFHSQSHFGAVFKKNMGMTPNKYRDKYSVIDVRRDDY